MTTIIHRPGCSTMRSGKCTCEFLSQWDSKPALPEPPKIRQEFGPNPGQYRSLSTEAVRDYPRYEYTREYVMELREALEKTQEARTSWRSTAILMLVCALCGWGYSIARGIWGF